MWTLSFIEEPLPCPNMCQQEYLSDNVLKKKLNKIRAQMNQGFTMTVAKKHGHFFLKQTLATSTPIY